MENKIAKRVGRRVEIALFDMRKTKIWLANEVGVDRTSISRLCLGIRLPSIEVLIKVVDAIGIPFEQLLK